MNVNVSLSGIAQTQQQLRTATQAAETMDKLRGIVASNVKYAPYVEYGTRFMRPRDFLGRAVGQVDPRLFAQALAEAVWKGPSDVRRVFNATLAGILGRAQRNAPVDTGQLRASLFTRLESR